MGRVDIDEFTKAVNTFEDVINSIKAEAQVLEGAATILRNAMTGQEAQMLLNKSKALTTQLYSQEQAIRSVINQIHSENEYYTKNLGILE